ncbi:MAG: glycerate kinase [Planctomycetota bacterium]|jgi:glycerate kinase
MKIVIAMDSFKGTLKACEACEIIADAISECVPKAQLVIKPMADGGEGTAEAMIKAANGRWIRQTVMGPLPQMQVEAGFAWFEDKTALVEMASASGLELLSAEQMNPLNTTTFGTGQLIKAALECGARKILLAVGGSATVDGGLGAATALGWKFLDHKDNPVQLGGAGLEKITKIVKPSTDSPLGHNDEQAVPVEVLCDVDNPLCGEHGAAKVYAPQKGATPRMVEQLENGLAHLAELVRKQFGRDIENVPGAGAAGGLAAGAVAFMDAAVVSGIETVMVRSNLRAELESADWVITGEGSFDRQSLYGKVVSGILKMACQSHTRLAVLAGQVNISKEEYRKIGVETAISSRPDNMPLHHALENSRALLYSAAQRFAKQYLSR